MGVCMSGVGWQRNHPRDFPTFFFGAGTVHRTERGLWQVAKQLGIQYAPALTGAWWCGMKGGRELGGRRGCVCGVYVSMPTPFLSNHNQKRPTTGFEVKNGRSVPVVEGVVVLQRDEAALLDAYGVRGLSHKGAFVGLTHCVSRNERRG